MAGPWPCFSAIWQLFMRPSPIDVHRLSQLPIQYADFAHWQRQALRDKLMENQLVYWKKQLEGPLTQVEFSTSRTRVNELNFLTARKSVSITGDLFRSLKKVSEREESTLFITLLTSLKILLYCYTGEGRCSGRDTRRESQSKRNRESHRHSADTLISRTSSFAGPAACARWRGRFVTRSWTPIRIRIYPSNLWSGSWRMR